MAEMQVEEQLRLRERNAKVESFTLDPSTFHHFHCSISFQF